MSKKESAAHYARLRHEFAEALGYDVDKLTATQEMRLDSAVALKLASNSMRAALMRGEDVDTKELLSVTEGLAKLLPREAEPEAAVPAIYKQDPATVMEGILDRWLAADEQDRRERGLSPRVHDEAEQQARIDELEAELAELRGESVAHARQLPSPERTIDVPDGDIVGPREQSDNPANARAPVRADDPKPPVTIDAKPEGSWTGPQDGPPSWLRPVPPTDPAKRPPASRPVAKSGAEAERQRQRANSDRSVEHKVMGSSDRFTS